MYVYRKIVTRKEILCMINCNMFAGLTVINASQLSCEKHSMETTKHVLVTMFQNDLQTSEYILYMLTYLDSYEDVKERLTLILRWGTAIDTSSLTSHRYLGLPFLRV